jgi:hypothetical protein
MTTKDYVDFVLDQMVVACERVGDLERQKYWLKCAGLHENSEDIARIQRSIIDNEKKIREHRKTILRFAPLTEYTEQ